MLTLILVGGAACLLVSFFGAAHNTLKAMSPRRLEEQLERRGLDPTIIRDRLDEATGRLPDLLLATGLTRASCALVIVLCAVMAVEQQVTAEPWLRNLVAFAVAGALMSVFTVALPVYWAAYRREKLLAWALPLLATVRKVLRPLLLVLKIFDPVVRRISGVEYEEDDEDLADQVLDAVERYDLKLTVNDAQRQMIEAIVDLGETDAGAVMTPRTEICGIPDGITLDALHGTLAEYGFSRLPVFEGNLDRIVGVLHAKDLIGSLGRGSESAEEGATDNATDSATDSAFDLRPLLREPLLVPATKPVRDLLTEFRQQRVHMAIVVDEHGGTAGLVTIEDVLEEIVGEIHDEHEGTREGELPAIEPLPDGRARVHARVPVGELNDRLGTALPEDSDFDTVGGFVLSVLGRIPVPGDAFTDGGVEVTVEDANRTSVQRVTVRKLETEAG